MDPDVETEFHYFEAGRGGKPDELDSGLANVALANALELVPFARCNIRVHGGYDRVGQKQVISVSGEVSKQLFDHNLQVIFEGEFFSFLDGIYKCRFNHENVRINLSELKPQDGVLAKNGAVHGPPTSDSPKLWIPSSGGESLDELTAGDSCATIAVAYKDGPFNLPPERYLAVKIRDALDQSKIQWLRPDGKVSVEAEYQKSDLLKIGHITVAAQHSPDIDLSRVRKELGDLVNVEVTEFIRKYSPRCSFSGDIAVNEKGPFVHGGWEVDEGGSDTKPHRDFFMSYGVCADSPTGEDSTKPEGPMTFLAREIANYIVRNNLAGFAKVSLAIDIGKKEPRLLHIYTNGTARVPLSEIYRQVREHIPLTYGKVVQRLELFNPTLYRQIARDSDYFQNPNLPWNK